MQDETTNVINRLKQPLWRERQRNDVTINTPLMYALTINPCSTARLNKKLYRNYSNDQQRAILGRIEACLRRKNPSIELIELHYEKCPSSGHIHFHALYSMPSIFQSTVMAYYRRLLDNSDDNTKVVWRYIYLCTVNDKEGWLQYIRKDITKD